jgi:hypothetical protein
MRLLEKDFMGAEPLAPLREVSDAVLEIRR